MGAKCAELIFIAGPQKGERVWVTAKTMVLGRMPQCDVCLKEEFVSRQHARMEITEDGIIVENLSSTGTVINDKRYKAGKKILLATGDVLAMGMESRLLFVGVGDDADTALAELRKREEPPAPPAQTPPAPAEPPAAIPPLPSPAAAKQTAPAAPPLPAPGKAKTEVPKTAKFEKNVVAAGAAGKPADRPAAQQKVRKYIKFGIVYAVALVALVIVIKFAPRGGGDDVGGPGTSGFLSREQIAGILRQKPDRKLNAVEADRALATAVELFPRRKTDPGNLYKVVSNFNYYLAAKEGSSVFEEAEHDTMYRTALDELVEAVASKYENAYSYERNRDYKTAKRIYGSLLEMLPVGTPGPVQEKLVKNIMEHLSFVSKRAGK